MKKNWFWGILIVIILSWIGNVIYFELHQLKEPFVLDAYIDIQASGNTNFSLFYLTNSSEVVELESLIIGEHTYNNEQNFFPWFGDVSAQSYRQQFTHQYLKQASFNFDEQSLNQMIKGIQTEELFARFTNGQVVPVQLEKLNFRSPTSESNIFPNEGSFSNNQGIQGYILKAAEEVRMDAIKLPDSLIHKMNFKVQVQSHTLSNSLDVNQLARKGWEEFDAPLYTDIEWPLELKKGDSLGLIFQEKYSNSYIDIVYDWTGITGIGKAFTYSFPLQIEPFLENQDVIDIVHKARGEYR